MKELPPKTISANLHDKVWLPVQRRFDIVETIEEDERFYIGDQWPRNNPDNVIRINSNHIADGIRKRASKINGTPLYLSFVASNDKVDCSQLQRFDSFVLSSMGHDAFSLQSAINGENLGTEITHMRYDADCPWITGGLFAGGLEEEHISPKNFAVANIHQSNIQKQEWVMTWFDNAYEELVEVLKHEKFTDSEYKERLKRLHKEALDRSQQPDDQNEDKDITARALIRVYYREFRIQGEVCYTLETETVPLFKYPKPYSKAVRDTFAKKVQEEFDKKAEKITDGRYIPDDDERSFSLVEDLGIDLEDTILSMDKAVSLEDHRKHREKFSLYTFAVFTPMVINNFFFGRSLTKEMIPIQKGVNYALSMMLKALENQAYGKIFYRDGAMKNGETFDNGPENNLQADHYKGNANGFYTITPPSVPADLFKIAEYYVNEMKDANGFSDFANGNMTNQETSGYAVSLMLKQANSTLEQEQKLFWQYQVDLARIRLQFYKHYVDEATYTYEMTDSEYGEEERARQTIMNNATRRAIAKPGEPTPMPLLDDNGKEIPFSAIKERYGRKTRRTQVRPFNGKDIWGTDFDVKIVAQQGLVESELSTQQWYTNMFANGGIQAFAQNPEMLDFIIKTAPKGVIPEEMRAAMSYQAESMQRSEIARLRQENAMLSQALEQAATFGKQQEEEFSRHIDAANRLVRNAQSDAQEARKGMSLMQQGMDEGEVKSNNAKGMNASVQAMQGQNPII